MPALGAGIHAFLHACMARKAWIAGPTPGDATIVGGRPSPCPRPAMTIRSILPALDVKAPRYDLTPTISAPFPIEELFE